MILDDAILNFGWLHNFVVRFSDDSQNKLECVCADVGDGDHVALF